MSTLVIVIDAGTDITMSALSGATPLGITAYAEPAILARVTYAPSSPWLHGETALGWSYDQALLAFTVAPFGQTTEAAAVALIDALRAAVSQFSFNVTVNVDGAGNKVWACNPGSVVPAGPRTRVDIRTHITEWNVTIPCHPVHG